MLRFKFVFILFAVFVSKQGWAGPLRTLPTIDEGHVRLVVDLRSDLWLRPNQDKLEPLRIYDTELHVPIYNDGTWLASVSAQNEFLSYGRTDLRVGPQQVLIGSSLRSEAFGIALGQRRDDGSSFSVFTSYRSDSDDPFRYARDRWYDVSFLYFSALNENGTRWILLADDSQNRGFYNGKWFPFFGAQFNPEPGLSYAVGFPFFRLSWAQDQGLSTTVIVTPTGVNGTASQQLNDNLQILSHFGLAVYSYLNTNRIEDDKRLFLEEKFADLGFRYRVSPETQVGFAVGGSVDRFAYEGERVFEPDADRVHLNSDFYGRLWLEFYL